jgi:hypothetical protein
MIRARPETRVDAGAVRKEPIGIAAIPIGLDRTRAVSDLGRC